MTSTPTRRHYLAVPIRWVVWADDVSCDGGYLVGTHEAGQVIAHGAARYAAECSDCPGPAGYAGGLALGMCPTLDYAIRAIAAHRQQHHDGQPEPR